MQCLQRGRGAALAGRGAPGAARAPAAPRRGARVARAAVPITPVAHQQQQPPPADAGAPSTSGAAPAARRALGGRVARFRATKRGAQVVQELPERGLAEYMALPASQYSVLDARKIERVDDSTFRCYVGQLGFLGFSVEPVITVSVTVEPRGCTIRLLSCRLQGSKAVEDVNDRFAARMTNAVVWAETEDAGAKQITSDTTLEVDVEVPGWIILPVSAVEAAGCGVMGATLNAMVPSFLRQLQADYRLWASGDDSRRPLGEGQL
ncbi:MAG: hypothetical protein J3K34DRAFT_461368 [Monoraphidium minutum]|nr:MAG: hypothetical protein J3K34DRAFT_461368 [Monoraphidium minutum]